METMYMLDFPLYLIMSWYSILSFGTKYEKNGIQQMEHPYIVTRQ
jgi:hypothetical protein